MSHGRKQQLLNLVIAARNAKRKVFRRYQALCHGRKRVWSAKFARDLCTSTESSSLLNAASGNFCSICKCQWRSRSPTEQRSLASGRLSAMCRGSRKKKASGREGLRCAWRQITSAVSGWRHDGALGSRWIRSTKTGPAKDEYTLTPSRTRGVSSDLGDCNCSPKRAVRTQECAPRVVVVCQPLFAPV